MNGRSRQNGQNVWNKCQVALIHDKPGPGKIYGRRGRLGHIDQNIDRRTQTLHLYFTRNLSGKDLAGERQQQQKSNRK
jgi:hypothetical protein